MDIRWIEGGNLCQEVVTKPAGPGIPDVLSGLVFDVCGVLYDTSPWRRWLLQLLHRIGLHTHFDLFYRVWEREFQDDVVTGKRPYWEAMSDYLRASGLSPGQVTEIAAAGRAKRKELEENVWLFPGVRRTLEQLSARGARLAIACSIPWPVSVIEQRLERLCIASLFSPITTTNLGTSIGALDLCLKDAAERLDLDPRQCAYISRDPNSLWAAQQADCHTIALHHSLDAVADLYLDRFDDLLRHLQFGAYQHQRLAG